MTLHKLNRFFDGHLRPYRDKNVDVVRHDDKVMNDEFSRFGVILQYVDEQHRHAFRLKKPARAFCLGGHEKRTRIREDFSWLGIA